MSIKNGVGFLRPHISVCSYPLLFGFGGKAIPAVYRLVAAGLKRDFRLFAALRASSGIHLAGTSVAVAAAAIVTEALSSFDRTARRATLGLIGEAFGREEFLLFSRKGERFAAIGTGKGFFCVSH
jgi:hypothetical protein